MGLPDVVFRRILTGSSVALASLSVVDVVDMSTLFRKDSNVFLLFKYLLFLVYSCHSFCSVLMLGLCSILLFQNRPMLLLPLLFHVLVNNTLYPGDANGVLLESKFPHAC